MDEERYDYFIYLRYSPSQGPEDSEIIDPCEYLEIIHIYANWTSDMPKERARLLRLNNVFHIGNTARHIEEWLQIYGLNDGQRRGYQSLKHFVKHFESDNYVMVS